MNLNHPRMVKARALGQDLNAEIAAASAAECAAVKRVFADLRKQALMVDPQLKLRPDGGFSGVCPGNRN